MTRQRLTIDLCQTCWQRANPDDYPPESHRYGKCEGCGEDPTLIYRLPRFVQTCDGMLDGWMTDEQRKVFRETGVWPK